jgi:multidrug efflux pump subunit AcrA (membrane-fusion protein)
MAGARRAARRHSRRLIGIAVAALLVAGAGGAYAFTHRSASAQTQPRTLTVSRGTVQQTVSASGTIEPATEADLSFQSAGTVNSVGVNVGQQVTKGEVLASIDTTALQGQVTLAQAVVTQAQAQVTAAGSSGSASQIAAADAQLASAQAKLLAAQQALSQARLTSPIDGVVAAVAVKVGSTVGGSGASGSSGPSSSGAGRVSSGGGTGGSAAGTGSTAASGSSSAAVSVISTNAWVVQTQVGNADLPSLKQGMQAQILPTGSRTTIYGTVESIGIVASSSSSGTSQFPVTIAVTGAPAGLYAGTAASVSIIVKQMDDVLTVPTAALSSSNGRTTVTVLQNGQQVTTPVSVGRIFGSRTEITAGLADGAQVVLPGTFGTRTGATGGTGGTGTRTGGFGGGGFGGGGFGGGGFGGNGGGGTSGGTTARNGG